MACRWESRKKSLPASRRKPRPSSACCWRRLPGWRHGSRNWKAGERRRRTPRCRPARVHPHAKPASTKRKSKKKRGGQPGHKKHERPLIPTEDCDDVKPLKPTECRRCGEKLSGSDPEPLRHQVWELPEIKPHVTEYQRHRLACPACGETTCAELPVRRAPGAVGAAIDGLHRAVDGLLSPKQAAHGRVPPHAAWANPAVRR